MLLAEVNWIDQGTVKEVVIMVEAVANIVSGLLSSRYELGYSGEAITIFRQELQQKT